MAKIVINEEKCKGCELCITQCPKKIIALSKDKLNKKGFHPAELIDPDKCIGCAFCATTCPDVAIEVYR